MRLMSTKILLEKTYSRIGMEVHENNLIKVHD